MFFSETSAGRKLESEQAVPVSPGKKEGGCKVLERHADGSVAV